jgi:hypothetical protein
MTDQLGTIKIMYYNVDNSTNVDIMIHGNVDSMMLSKTHMEVYREENVKIPEKRNELLEGLFGRFNGVDSPMLSLNKQRFIRKYRLHTSISVGDVVEISIIGCNKELWVCKMIGWNKLK